MANQSGSPGLAPDVVHPLVTYRKQRGLTQAGLAAELEVARESVARWERGRRIADDLLPTVSEKTGIPRGVLAAAHLAPDAAAHAEEITS